MVSGGPDSVAMLLKYKDVASGVIHINHGIRHTSKNDADFVESLCDELNIESYIFEANLGPDASENAARVARHKILAENFNDHECVFYTAHTMDDVAETVLFNLFRGSGVFGSCSLKKDNTIVYGGVSLRFHRPMLGLRKSDILKYLKDEDQHYVIDETNNTDNYTRNAIRHRVIPTASMVMDRDVVPSLYKFALNAQDTMDMIDKCPVPFAVLHESNDPTGRYDPFVGCLDYIDCVKYANTSMNKHLMIKLIKPLYNTSKFAKKHWDAVHYAMMLGVSTQISLPGIKFTIRKKKAKFEFVQK